MPRSNEEKDESDRARALALASLVAVWAPSTSLYSGKAVDEDVPLLDI